MKASEHSYPMLRLIKRFCSTVIPSVLRPLHILWNEVLGGIFLAFAIVVARPTWKAWQNLDADPGKILKLAVYLFLLVLMAGYAIHAFWRARKIGRT